MKGGCAQLRAFTYLPVREWGGGELLCLLKCDHFTAPLLVTHP